MRIEKLMGTALAMFLVGGVSGVTYQMADGGSMIPPPQTVDGGSMIPPPHTVDGGSMIPPPVTT
jgi:signal peptidase I